MFLHSVLLDTQTLLQQRVTLLGDEMDRVTYSELQDIWGGWVLDAGQTKVRKNEYLCTLEIYWQVNHLFFSLIIAGDQRIMELQCAQLATNNQLAYLQEKRKRIELPLKLINARIEANYYQPSIGQLHTREEGPSSHPSILLLDEELAGLEKA